jgi:hypothetical protein
MITCGACSSRCVARISFLGIILLRSFGVDSGSAVCKDSRQAIPLGDVTVAYCTCCCWCSSNIDGISVERFAVEIAELLRWCYGNEPG